jgi:KR domain
MLDGCFAQLSNNAVYQPDVLVPAQGIIHVCFNVASLLKDDLQTVCDILLCIQEMRLQTRMQPAAFNIEQMGVRHWDLATIADAFRAIADDPYFGLQVLSAGPDSSLPLAIPLQSDPQFEVVSPHATYILAGGLGGLGRSIATLLVESGARHLLILTRSSRFSKEADEWVSAMRQRKELSVEIAIVDICDFQHLERLLSRTFLEENPMPPVAAIFQCAGVIQVTTPEK